MTFYDFLTSDSGAQKGEYYRPPNTPIDWEIKVKQYCSVPPSFKNKVVPFPSRTMSQEYKVYAKGANIPKLKPHMNNKIGLYFLGIRFVLRDTDFLVCSLQ